MTEPGPSKGLTPLREAVNDTMSAVVWGMEGTGKTLHILRDWPAPIVILNLDRPLTRAHLGFLEPERIDQIHVRNLRGGTQDITLADALRIKKEIEETINQNLKWLAGGTLLLDGGTTYRTVINLADPIVGPKLAKGEKVYELEKGPMNLYLEGMVNFLQDQGINPVITAHAAHTWKSDGPTTSVYPKVNSVFFAACNLSILLLKRCECGRNVISQDGACSVENAAGTPSEGHQGRQHIGRIVTNKFFTATEGSEWPDLTYARLRDLCFNPSKAKLLMEANPLGKRP